ncbi:L-type lectin-domain containing receptor kinase S.5 [Pyrus ussuriensis x Pyrus communis]|uniref:L-type lectin-domain containing receptor kinase S.5 n=1 Tax=Pyrus ussuriensis x Pyrus communis TaxID=2448454 RepID=A0A5N5G6G7_9ROSA|nr:L-type lectin-domain containing receptor kinase S.5 [Pyrus ussuriensis x Pyrus communis]
MAWHGPRFGLPRQGCLPKMRKLLEFDFLVVVDKAVKNGAAHIGAAEDEVSDEQIVECKVVASP